VRAAPKQLTRVPSVAADHTCSKQPDREGTLAAGGGSRRRHNWPGVQILRRAPIDHRGCLLTGLAVPTVELVQQPRGKARGWVAQRRSSLPTPARLWLIQNVQPGKPFPTIAIWDANKTQKSAPGRRCCRERGAANRAPGRRRPVRFVRRADRLSVRNAKQA
jgi:hypothetical protein